MVHSYEIIPCMLSYVMLARRRMYFVIFEYMTLHKCETCLFVRSAERRRRGCATGARLGPRSAFYFLARVLHTPAFAGCIRTAVQFVCLRS